MRYEDWDILLFPRDCKIPLKEFKVACHVVQDNEFAHIHGPLGLPTICCFVPSLAPGAPYKLSIHSWSTPLISQFTHSYGKYADRIVFEARLFVDGQLISTSSMNRTGPWPNVLKDSFDVSEAGELYPLNFPSFQRELLNQCYWSPADNLGRIKLIISESYPRDSLTMPLERVKNVVAFSFQHAPLDILESSAIAWPNPSMWRSMPFRTSLPNKTSDHVGSHAHSPRPRHSSGPSSLTYAQSAALPRKVKNYVDAKPSILSLQNALPTPALLGADPFVEASAYFEWLSGIGMGLSGDSNASTNVQNMQNVQNVQNVQNMQGANRIMRKSSTDLSMPDYLSSNNHTPPPAENSADNFTGKHDDETEGSHMKVPTNTPTTCDLAMAQTDGIPFPILSTGTPTFDGLGDSLSSSFISQSTATPPLLVPTPAMEVKSRKENKNRRRATSPSTDACLESLKLRNVSKQIYSAGNGTVPKESPRRGSSGQSTKTLEKSVKRVRNFTPSSTKPFEEDEEPRRASPRVRLDSFDESATA